MGDQQDLTQHQTPTAEPNTIMNKLLLISLFLTITLISISTAQNGRRRPSNGQQKNSRKLESMKNPGSRPHGNKRNLKPGQKEGRQNLKNQGPNNGIRKTQINQNKRVMKNANEKSGPTRRNNKIEGAKPRKQDPNNKRKAQKDKTMRK